MGIGRGRFHLFGKELGHRGALVPGYRLSPFPVPDGPSLIQQQLGSSSPKLLPKTESLFPMRALS
jgi:hypothetical protein